MEKEDFLNKAVNIIRKVARDNHSELRLRLDSIHFIKQYDKYLKEQEFDENDV